MTRRVDPMALAGKLVANLAKTFPLLPWVVLILPQMVCIKKRNYFEFFALLSGGSFENVYDSLSEIV